MSKTEKNMYLIQNINNTKEFPKLWSAYSAYQDRNGAQVHGSHI